MGLDGRTDQLMELIYTQLRAVAQEALHAERRGHTLQATALVNEAYLRLANEKSQGWSCKAEFFTTAVTHTDR